MSLLTVVQSLYVKVFSSRPAVIEANSDPKVQQAIEYTNEAGQELAARYSWQVLTTETVFTSVAAESQGSLSSLTGPGFAFIVNNTMWNRSQRRPVPGPLSDADWQQIKAQYTQGPWSQYRVRGNQLLFLPAPPANMQIAFEWCTKYWCSNSAGTVFNSQYTDDTDVSLLDERVIALDALWRLKRANKLAYDDDYNKAQAAIEDLIVRDGSKPTLNVGGWQPVIQPGVFVPAGNFGIT